MGDVLRLQNEVENLQAEVKAQAEIIERLLAQPKLNRQEVEKILDNNLYFDVKEECITAILNLAIPEMDKDRIVKVLKTYFNDDTPNRIANEIIGEVGE